MEKSRDELLAGMRTLEKTEPFPDELFYAIFEIRDRVEQQRYLEALRNEARKLRRITEFNNLFREYQLDYIQRMKQKGNRTAFTDQPVELACGEWKAGDFGIWMERYEKSLQPVRLYACSHPIMPVEILKNVDTSEERITLAYYKSALWQQVTVNRSVCANTNKIVDALSQYGIEVTSDNARELVRYISDCVSYNPVTLKPKRSINRLGWVGREFTPYEADIRYEGDPEYEPVFKNISQHGDPQSWENLCAGLRGNRQLRLMMDASFASVLIEQLRILPFVFHVWGESGTCKTVALMVAMSI